MTPEKKFYSYLWLRLDGTPYYAGKGCGNRAFRTRAHNVHCPKDASRILVFPMVSEVEAFESEIALIELFGRKDLGTGCLRNLTDGGDGTSGHVMLASGKAKLSASKTGRNLGKTPWNKGKTGVFSSDARQRMSLAHRGKSFSDTHKQALSKSLKGRTITWGDKISASNQQHRNYSNHIRWHIRRDITNIDCRWCEEQTHE